MPTSCMCLLPFVPSRRLQYSGTVTVSFVRFGNFSYCLFTRYLTIYDLSKGNSTYLEVKCPMPIHYGV